MRSLSLLMLLSGAATLACSGTPAPPPTPAAPPAVAPVVLPPMPTLPAAPVATAPLPTDMAFYYTRPIVEADLTGKSLRELTLLRNTVYARAGNPFRKKWLDSYFRAQAWYQPRAQMDESLLTALDRANAATVARYEASLTRVTLGTRLGQLMEGLKGSTSIKDDDLIELVLLSRASGDDLTQTAASWEVTLPERIHTLIDVTPLDDPKMLTRQLAVEDLRDLSKRDLRLLRNTIYARHGREFKSPTLEGYFGRMEWYKADPAYTDARLSDLDRRNITLVQSVEDSIGGPMTEHEQQTAESWFDGA